jgi:hypothetical protein
MTEQTDNKDSCNNECVVIRMYCEATGNYADSIVSKSLYNKLRE